MKKLITIFAIIAAVTIPFLTAFSAGADISYEQDDNKVTISGSFSQSLRAENVSVVITKKGVNLTEKDYTDSKAKEYLELVHDAVTDQNGKWFVVWYPSDVAYYTVKATVNSTGESAESEFYFVEESRVAAINNALLYGTQAELENIFSNPTTMYVLKFGDDDISRVKDLSKIGTALYYIRKDLENTADIYNEIGFALLLAEFNEKGIGFENVNSKMAEYAPVKNMEFYKNETTAAVREQTALNVARGILLSGYSGYDKLFTDSLILAGVKKSEQSTYIMGFLELLGYEKYDNASPAAKMDVCDKIWGNDYSSTQELKNAVDTALTPQPGGSDTGGGSGGRSDIGDSTGGSAGLSNTTGGASGRSAFSDITPSYWAYNAIEDLYNKKISVGYGDNTYRPENPLTRAEAVVLLCRVFNILGAENENTFEDVNNDDWFSSHVSAAAKNGCVNGNGKSFEPYSNITRQDLCVMIYRFANLKAEQYSSSYNDAGEIASYAQEAVNTLSGNGIINGFEDNTFRPFDNATRAQMAQIIYKYFLAK